MSREEDRLLEWVQVLTGLEPNRVAAARREVAGWSFAHSGRELLALNVDAAVAATLMSEDVAALVDRGAARASVMRKIRQDQTVWSTFAEMRAAALLLRMTPPDAEVRVEQDRREGAHADFRIVSPSGDGANVEVKAIGLSNDEVAFCQRQAPTLRRLVPPFGIVHMHGDLDDETPVLNRSFRREQFKIAARSARETPMFPPGMGAAVIVGHGSEEAYVRRAVRRIVQAVRQLPTSDDESWVAVYWSNGAPMEQVHGAVPWSQIPEHIVGIILVGCGVAFPHAEIHCFTSALHRRASEDDALEIRSANSGQDDYAALVLRMFEQSSGVRPTMIEFDKTVALLRDGQRRILPFNLLLARDPQGLDRATFMATRARTF